MLVVLEALFGQICRNTKTESPRDFRTPLEKYLPGVNIKLSPEMVSISESTEKCVPETNRFERPTTLTNTRAPIALDLQIPKEVSSNKGGDVFGSAGTPVLLSLKQTFNL